MAERVTLKAQGKAHGGWVFGARWEFELAHGGTVTLTDGVDVLMHVAPERNRPGLFSLASDVDFLTVEQGRRGVRKNVYLHVCENPGAGGGAPKDPTLVPTSNGGFMVVS